MRKFALALEYGSNLSDLQEVGENIKLLADILTVKETEESNKIKVEKLLHPNQSSSVA